MYTPAPPPVKSSVSGTAHIRRKLLEIQEEEALQLRVYTTKFVQTEQKQRREVEEDESWARSRIHSSYVLNSIGFQCWDLRGVEEDETKARNQWVTSWTQECTTLTIRALQLALQHSERKIRYEDIERRCASTWTELTMKENVERMHLQIMPAQRAWRCHVARKVRNAKVLDRMGACRAEEEAQRLKLMTAGQREWEVLFQWHTCQWGEALERRDIHLTRKNGILAETLPKWYELAGNKMVLWEEPGKRKICENEMVSSMGLLICTCHSLYVSSLFTNDTTTPWFVKYTSKQDHARLAKTCYALSSWWHDVKRGTVGWTASRKAIQMGLPKRVWRKPTKRMQQEQTQKVRAYVAASKAQLAEAQGNEVLLVMISLKDLEEAEEYRRQYMIETEEWSRKEVYAVLRLENDSLTFTKRVEFEKKEMRARCDIMSEEDGARVYLHVVGMETADRNQIEAMQISHGYCVWLTRQAGLRNTGAMCIQRLFRIFSSKRKVGQRRMQIHRERTPAHLLRLEEYVLEHSMEKLSLVASCYRAVVEMTEGNVRNQDLYGWVSSVWGPRKHYLEVVTINGAEMSHRSVLAAHEASARTLFVEKHIERLVAECVRVECKQEPDGRRITVDAAGNEWVRIASLYQKEHKMEFWKKPKTTVDKSVQRIQKSYKLHRIGKFGFKETLRLLHEFSFRHRREKQRKKFQKMESDLAALSQQSSPARGAGEHTAVSTALMLLIFDVTSDEERLRGLIEFGQEWAWRDVMDSCGQVVYEHTSKKIHVFADRTEYDARLQLVAQEKTEWNNLANACNQEWRFFVGFYTSLLRNLSATEEFERTTLQMMCDHSLYLWYTVYQEWRVGARTLVESMESWARRILHATFVQQHQTLLCSLPQGNATSHSNKVAVLILQSQLRFKLATVLVFLKAETVSRTSLWNELQSTVLFLQETHERARHHDSSRMENHKGLTLQHAEISQRQVAVYNMEKEQRAVIVTQVLWKPYVMDRCNVECEELVAREKLQRDSSVNQRNIDIGSRYVDMRDGRVRLLQEMAMHRVLQHNVEADIFMLCKEEESKRRVLDREEHVGRNKICFDSFKEEEDLRVKRMQWRRRTFGAMKEGANGAGSQKHSNPSSRASSRSGTPTDPHRKPQATVVTDRGSDENYPEIPSVPEPSTTTSRT